MSIRLCHLPHTVTRVTDLASAAAPALDYKHPGPFVDIGPYWQATNRCKVRKHFTQEMRPCRGHQSRTSYHLAVIDGQDVSGVLIIELVALQSIGTSQIRPVSLHDVNLVAQTKMSQQFAS